MKVIGGSLKNRNFFRPEDIRPTQNLIRKSIFDILGQDVSSIDFLDLFSGSGAVGIEALSRDVKSAVFVEKSLKCVNIIQENIDLLGISADAEMKSRYEVITSDAFAAIKYLKRIDRRFDAIFIDPPYGRGLARKALKTLCSYDIFKPNCTIIIEHVKDEILPKNEGRFLLFKQKKHTKTLLSIYEIQE